MKEVVLSESLTEKTVAVKVKHFFQDGTFIAGGTIGTLGGISLSTMTGEPFYMLLTVALTAWGHVFSDSTGIAGAVKAYSKGSYTKKELNELVPEGGRVQVGEKISLNSIDELQKAKKASSTYGNLYSPYEAVTYVTKTNGKLAVENVVSERPEATWQKAYEAILANDGITEDDIENVEINYLMSPLRWG